MSQLPRGTRDFTPEEMYIRRYIEESIRKTFLSFGYGEVQTPTFEHLELFTAKSGQSIINELYNFTDKSGRELTLRPELTAPVIRFYVERLQMEPKPLKLFYLGNCFRYDRPQKGRYREFWQAGCELIGADTPEAYAELIALAYTILHNIGLKDFHLNLGNLSLIQALFKKLSVSVNDQKNLLPLIDKSQFDELLDALKCLGLSSQIAEEVVALLQTSDIPQIQNFFNDTPEVHKELLKLRQIITLLQQSFQIPDVSVKLSIVRGLDYYKGLVFEIEAPKLGAEKQLCGGGSYDLVGLFGGKDVPTAGFAIGFDRSILALETQNVIFPKPALDIYIIPYDETCIEKSFELAQLLRKDDYQVDVDLLRRGIGKSLKFASTKNARHAIILGPDELNRNVVMLRDMRSGEQQSIPVAELLTYLKKSRT
ncbi:MAG: histidine--tRNA ligase [Candidatus Thermoplasmatota archaeon]